MDKKVINEMIQLEEQAEEILGVIAAVNVAVNCGADDLGEYIGALELVEKVLRKQVSMLQHLSV